MSTEMYMRIVKDLDPDADPTGAAVIAKLASPIPLPGVICGDSLDMPFLKWMKLTGFKNSIGFAGSGSEREIVGAGTANDPKRVESVGYDLEKKSSGFATARGFTHAQVVGEETRYWDEDGNVRFKQKATQIRGRHKRTYERTRSRTGQYRDWNREARATQWHMPKFDNFVKNNFLNINLPDHGDISFTKSVDNATPQLAYGCSCQEPIGMAVIFFRRRIGLGVRGIRVPFLCVVLSKCLLTSWELDGETEQVSMSYEEIRWCTYDQMADFNVATGMSARKWDATQNTGGESGWMYLVMGGIAALAMAGALTDTIASSESGPAGGQGVHGDDAASGDVLPSSATSRGSIGAID